MCPWYHKEGTKLFADFDDELGSINDIEEEENCVLIMSSKSVQLKINIE